MEIKFSEILNEFLTIKQLSQTECAKTIGVKQSQVCEWLHEKAKPGYDTLKSMATAFGVSADYFLGLTDKF